MMILIVRTNFADVGNVGTKRLHGETDEDGDEDDDDDDVEDVDANDA